MGQSDLALQGYPRSHLKSDYTFKEYCGGGGIVQPTQLQSRQFVVYALDVNPFITRNRDLILYTNFWDVYLDAAATTEAPFYVALDGLSTLTAAQIIAQGNKFKGVTGTNLEFIQAKLPQPTESGWNSKIYVYLYWGSGPIYAFGQYVNDVQYFTPVKFDFDVRQ